MFRAGAVDLKPGVYTANEIDDKNVSLGSTVKQSILEKQHFQ